MDHATAIHRLGLGIVTLRPQQFRQVVQTRRDLRMIEAQLFFSDRQRAAKIAPSERAVYSRVQAQKNSSSGGAALALFDPIKQIFLVIFDFEFFGQFQVEMIPVTPMGLGWFNNGCSINRASLSGLMGVGLCE